MINHKRINIFIGHYGSGKTELAINFSLYLQKQIDTVIILVDLDVINPYFRSRDKTQFLEEQGIDVVYPQNLVFADLPVISAEVKGLLQNGNKYGVIDVGGDEDGALALASVIKKVDPAEYEVDLVVNTFRNFTNTVDKIINTKKRIEDKSGVKVDSLICNPNLGQETTPEVVNKGYKLISKASDKMGIPVKFVSVREDLVNKDLQFEEEIFPLKIFMKPPWEK